MNCKELLPEFFSHVENKFTCRKLDNGRLAIVTPYFYPDHDNIEVFVREKNGAVVVSDLGETLRNLETHGMDVIGNVNLKYAAEKIAGGFNARIQDGVIRKEGDKSIVTAILHDVLSACSAVASMYYGSRAYEPAKFDDEAESYFEEHGFTANKNVPIIGTSRIIHKASLVLTHKNGEPLNRQQCIKTISPKTQSGIRREVNAACTMWVDLENDPNVVRATLFNDELVKPSEAMVRLISSQSDIYFWSKREQMIEALLAKSRA